jgi:PKD repeat protein
MGLQASGCKDNLDDEDFLKTFSPLSLNTYTLDTYVISGKTAHIGSVCEPALMGPDKPVFVWRMFHNGNLIEEITHDSDTSPFSLGSDNSTFYRTGEEEATHEKYSWPNFDQLQYTFNEPGTYTIETTLYEYDEYSKDGNKALIVSNDSLTIYCDTIKLSIEAAPAPGVREFSFKATIENPQFIKLGYPIKWEFINVSTGQPDAGLTEEVSGKDSLLTTGVQEVDHTFQNAGKYKAMFTISNYESSGKNPIASAETTIDVTTGFTIVPPQGSLKTGQEYRFIARTNSPNDLTEAPSYEWDFGDGTMKVIPYSNEVIHSFDKPGKHVIYVEVFDSEEEAANVLGTAYLTINIEESSSHLLELHKMKKFALSFAVQHDYVEGMSGVFSWAWDSYGEVIWDGINFSMEWSQYNHSERMTGRVSEDGTLIEQLKMRHEFIDSKGLTEWYELEIQNLPFWEDTMPDRFIVDIDDEEVGKYVTYFNSYRTAGYQWNNEARLYVRFLPE